jgi:methionine aminotransferase
MHLHHATLNKSGQTTHAAMSASLASPSSPPAPTLPAGLPSRLPKVGTTIFTVMSQLAAQHGAINLGQGFPDFDCDPALLDAVTRAMHGGALANQYPPMAGLPVLREAIAAKVQALYGASYDPATEITITAGATQAILTTILALVHPGDEVIVIEPAYDSYVPNIELAGGVPVFVPLNPTDYAVPWDRVRAAITPRTRLLMLNFPHNPTATTLKAADIAELKRIVADTGIWLLSDEVYEHMVFDGLPHNSLARYPELRERAVIVSSFGKTYHVTGWKVGYVLAPAALMAEFRKVHQFNVFTVNTPMQAALAAYMADPAPYLNLPAFYQAKRDRFAAGLASTRFRLRPSEGTYFLLASYEDLDMPLGEEAFCKWLTTEVGVAAIPLSPFYAQPVENKMVRFCFAKKDETLDAALTRLQAL